MSNVTSAMRQHHQELQRRLSEQTRLLDEGKPEADPLAFADFLSHELLGHAAGEERALYPAVEPLLAAAGRATATMQVDHRFIADYVRRIDELARAYDAAPEEARGEVRRRLARAALQLEAIFLLHLRKEEDVYLPLVEQNLSPEAQEALLRDLHEEAEATGPAPGTLDVRELAPAQRHGLIFQTFAKLAPGEAFVLVNDHAPKPLYYQFKFEHAGEFSWHYLEQGPQVWRVRIGKTAPAPATNA